MKIDNLKKVWLTFEAGTNPDEMNLAPPHMDYPFIYGIGSGGLTPFEYELADKSEADEFTMHLRKMDVRNVFEHLNPPVLQLIRDHDELFLKIKIKKVTMPDNREIVKAMADLAAHGGGGCDCDCGCG